MDNSVDKTAGNWWVNRSRETRTWIFFAAAWFVLGMSFVLVFDPAGYLYRWKGHFRNMDAGESVRLWIVLGLPLIAWLVRHLYLRFVVSPAGQEGPRSPAMAYTADNWRLGEDGDNEEEVDLPATDTQGTTNSTMASAMKLWIRIVATAVCIPSLLLSGGGTGLLVFELLAYGYVGSNLGTMLGIVAFSAVAFLQAALTIWCAWRRPPARRVRNTLLGLSISVLALAVPVVLILLMRVSFGAWRDEHSAGSPAVLVLLCASLTGLAIALTHKPKDEDDDNSHKQEPRSEPARDLGPRKVRHREYPPSSWLER